MKKLLVYGVLAFFAILTFCLTCAVCGHAEVIEIAADVAQGVEAVVDVVQESSPTALPTAPFTWQALGTIAGCTAFALLFVQLIKAPLDKVWKIPTRLLVYVVCLVVMLASAAFSGGLTSDATLLACINAVIPTLAAMGAYEVTYGRAKKPPDNR